MTYDPGSSSLLSGRDKLWHLGGKLTSDKWLICARILLFYLLSHEAIRPQTLFLHRNKGIVLRFKLHRLIWCILFFLLDVEDAEVMGSPHVLMEHKLGIL